MIDLDDPQILERFKGEKDPSLTKDVAELSPSERLALFLELRSRVIRERFGHEPEFERVAKFVRCE